MEVFLKSGFAVEESQALELPIHALLGVTSHAAEVLTTTLNIHTIFDLAANDIFAHARRIVEATSDEASAWSRCGRIPTGVIDRKGHGQSTDFMALAKMDIEMLVGIGPATGPRLKEALAISSVRDLALWPPYANARKALNANIGATADVVGENETPGDLLPTTGRFPTERTQYGVLVMDRLLREYPLQSLESGARINVMEADAKTEWENNPAFGAMLTYTQSWYTLGVTLGQLLHSLALAPGESTRLAVVDWTRVLTSKVTESAQETETLTADLLRTRSIREVVSAVAAEMQRGKSGAHSESRGENFGFGFGYGTGTGTAGNGSYQQYSGVAAAGDAMGLGLSYGTASGSGTGWAWSSSLGKREMAADTAQSITDRTHQASMATRNRWASVVREVSQKEHESLSTRSVTNFNHMHAMTVQYYEVVQIYRVVAELSKVQRCIFLPMEQLDFSGDGVVKRFRQVLAANALSPSVRMLAVADLGSLSIGFPSSGAIDAQSRGYYLDWGVRNGVGVNTTERAVILNSGGDAFDVSGFHVMNPEGTKKEDFVFKSLSIELSDGTVLEQNLQSVGDQVLQTCPRAGFYHPSRPFPLSKIRRMFLRRNTGRGPSSDTAPNVDIILKNQAGNEARLCGARLQLVPGSELTTVWELAPVDYGQWTRIKDDLAANRLHYSQAVWRAMDPAALSQVLSGYSLVGRQLLDLIDITPIGVAGSYLVFPLNLDDAQWGKFKHERGLTLGTSRESIVALPSGGVFAEAVLGRSNSAEKLDLTRFWNWADSPIPVTASDIAPLAAGSRSNPNAETAQPQTFGAPLLNIVNPPAAPDPSGMTAILAAIQNGNMFRDMSGLSGVIGMAQAGVAAALQAAQSAAGTAADEAKSAMTQAGKNLETAAKALEAIYGKGGGSIASGSGGTATKAPSNISEVGAKYNTATKLDKETAASGANGAKGGSSGDGAKPGDASGSNGAGASRRDQVLGTDSGQFTGSVQLVGTTRGTPIPVDRSFDGEKPNGIDVSDHQGLIDWEKVRGAGVRFAFIKATEGLNPPYRKVATFTRNWSGANDAGIIRGAYHYLRPEFDGKAQADYFLSTVGEIGAGILPPVLDIEETGGLSADKILECAQLWIDTVTQHYGLTPIIYTYAPFWRDKLGNTDRFKDHMLWLANTSTTVEPQLIGSWPSWDFWQYSFTGRVDGIPKPVDLNIYNGTLLELCRQANFQIGDLQATEANWI